MKQNLELAEIAAAISTLLSNNGLGAIPTHSGFAVGEQIIPPLISLYFLPNGPKPFQMGDTTEKYFNRVIQFDIYMESDEKVSLIIDILMDYLDTMALYINDPMQNNAVVGSITCQNSDSIYGQIVTPNYEKPKVIRWRGIVRATLDIHYPND
jgi:hypothetical protein